MSEPRLPSGYELIRPLGRSPLSQVFLVANSEGDRFALKVLRGSAARDPRLIERFNRESRLLQELRHPNLVQGFGSIEVEGRPALLLEYIEGHTLRDAVSSGPLTWEKAARYGVQISRALDKLHRSGALHRDVKPHNVLLHHRRGAVLADLGLVRREDDPTLTRQGAALGSPAYMSPEQTRDPSGVGPEADVYSLGATLFHAMAGNPPFLGRGVGEVIHRVLHLDPEPLPDAVPESMQRVLTTAMAKDPERRYARVRDLGSDLGRVLLGHTPRLVTRHRRRRRLRLAATAASLVLISCGTWFAYGLGWLPFTSAPAEVEEVRGNGIESPTGPAGGSALAEDLGGAIGPLYQSWAAPFEDRYRRAYEDGAYRMAWQALRTFEDTSIPETGRAIYFKQLRRDFVQTGRQRLENRAAEIFVDVAEVLQARNEVASSAIEAGRFDAQEWARESTARIEQEIPRARQLPMFPGDENPAELVRSYRLTLERRNREEWKRRASSLVPVLRPRLDDLLVGGDFETAWALWQELDTRLLDHSLDAQREGWRLVRLVEAETRLEETLSKRLGFTQEVMLLSGPVRGRVTLPAKGDRHWCVQVDGGSRVAIELLQLDVNHLGEWFEGEDRDLQWLAGQLSWCQGRGDEAVRRMDELALQEWESVADPFFWAREWEAALALRPESLGNGKPDPVESEFGSPPGVDPAVAQPVVVAGDALTQLQRELADELLDARFERIEGNLVVRWENAAWHPSWLRTFRLDRRRWRLAAWGAEWVLPVGRTPPDELKIWGDVSLRRMGSSWRLQVGQQQADGMRLVPGARQGFTWSGGDLLFDGWGTLPWTPPRGRRLSLRGESSDAFRADSVWLVIAPQTP